MLLRTAAKSEVEKLTEMSQEAFHTDYLVGGEPDDGPPDYDSVIWHEQMRQEGHLYAYLTDNESSVKELKLDTPLVNVRTNAFYRKLGYVEIKRTEDTVSYRKIISR